MLSIIAFLAALVLVGASLLQFQSVENLTLWKITIAATELGHWIALTCLILFSLNLYLRPLSKLRVLSGVLILLAAIFYMRPMVEMQLSRQGWMDSIVRALGRKESNAQSHQDATTRPATEKTFTYRDDKNQSLSLDAYLATATAPTPWVLVVHGGSWAGGDRKQLPQLNMVLASQAISVFSIDYRLAPQFHWPAPREDVAEAVKFIKDRAKEFNIDPERWAILGRSAGGQIAESYAFHQNDSTLKGVIAFYAPADMNFAYEFGREDDILASRQVLRDYLGGTPDQVPDSYKDASPIDDVSPSAPPVLMFHGPNDPLVWAKQSQRLDAKLKSLGVPSILIELPWATHAFDYTLSGPGGQVSTDAVISFLKKVFLE
jgi:acetyl esterase/lipase